MKKFLVLLFLIVHMFYIFSEENLLIGISSPFLRNENSSTMFYNKQFSFEILFKNNSDKISYEIINIDEIDIEKESEYIKTCKRIAINNGYDYLLYSSVYSNDLFLFFKVQLLNPYTDDVIFIKLFIKKIDYTLSETISDCSEEIINVINSSSLDRIQGKNLFKENIKKEEGAEEQLDQYATRFKHEIFFLNSFLKNHSNTVSLVEIYSGYNFSPFDFFSIEAALFWGYGFKDSDLSFSKITEETNFFIGQSAGFYFNLPLIVEPSLGLRLEINYIINDHFYFTFPIDLGLKIYIRQKHAIRINTSFQFITYDINDFKWSYNFMIGFMVGYALKI